MKTTRCALHALPLSVMTLALAGALLPATGCDDPTAIAEQCGLSCPAEGVLQGNASISGIASMDAFFGAVIDTTGAIDGLSASARAELDGIGASLGLEAGASGADIKAAIDAKVAANVSGSLTVDYAPPKCEASLEVTASAAAACEADLEPGSVEVKCEGSCSIDASAQADCSAKGTLSCKGPKAQCEGTCSGNCQLTVATACSGTCRGDCVGTCSVQNADGSCAGQCDGECQGTCEMSSGATCEGVCEGECEFEAPSCEGGFEAKCDASADANIECKGGCEGEVTPPQVSAKCEASVEAKANVNVTCTPPIVDISWQFSADLQGDLTAQAEFRAWVGSFKGRLGAIAALNAKASLLADAGGNLLGAAGGAVNDSFIELSADVELKTAIGAACALTELESVPGMLSGSIQVIAKTGEDVGAVLAIAN